MEFPSQPGTIVIQNTDSFSPRRYKLPIAPLLGVELCVQLPVHADMLSGLDLHRLVCVAINTEFICAAASSRH